MFSSHHRSYRMVLTLLMLMLSAVMAQAQPGRNMKIQAEGTVVDSKTGEPLVGAAVKVTSADGGTGTFGICDSNGKFTFEVNHPGKFTLDITYVSYKELTKEVNIFPGRGKLGTFKLKEDPHVLAEVETIGHSERIKQRGDTLAYNADAYKVQDGASAEELVAKLPGIEVSSDGVKAQGESVKKVLVDGKEFFDNDVKMALRSLPAEVLESVNVFDKKSDQAEFTGIDDGETVKAMDLVTKAYRRNGVFGKVFGGIGNNFDWNNGYWNTGFNINVFNGNRRITLQGMSNNVNERNFSNDDMMSGGGMRGGRQWGSTGVARTNGIGINYSDAFANDKLNVQLSYFWNQSRVVNADTTYTDSFEREMTDADGNPYVVPKSSAYSDKNSLSHSQSHSIGGRISYKPSATDEIMLRPSLNFQTSDGLSHSESRQWEMSLDSMTQFNRWDDYLSMNTSKSSSESDTWNIGGDLLWRHRLAKAGRTLSVRINTEGSGSTSKSYTNQVMNYYEQGNTARVSRPDNQLTDSENSNARIGGNIQWTEPIVTGLNLSLRYGVNYSRSKREVATDLYSDADFNTFLSRDANNSNTYTQKNLRNNGELGLSYKYQTLRVNASLRFENSKLEGEQDYYLLKNSAKSFSTSKSYNSFLPNLRLEYRTAGGTQFRLNYRSNSSNPSVSNLQKSVNTSNRQRYSTGNPDLDQSTTHDIFMNMIYTNTETAQNFMIFGGFNFTMDRIVNQSLTNRTQETLALKSLEGYTDEVFADLSLAPGASITRPINRDGYKTAFLNLGYGFPFDLIWSNVNLSVEGNYSLNPSNQLYYFGDKDTNGNAIIRNVESKTSSVGFRPNIHISSNISPDLNFNLSYRPSFQWNYESGTEENDKNFIDQNVNASLNWTFWNGFTTDQSLNYSYSGGSAQPEAITQWIWNAALGKKFLKGNKAEIKLQAYDILGSNKGFSRSVGDSNITTTYRNFMPRYFLLTFTYKITAYRAGGKKSTTTDDSRGGFGGRGGFPGGGPGGFGGGGPF